LLLASGVAATLWLTGCTTTTPQAATPVLPAVTTPPGLVPDVAVGAVVQVSAQWGFVVLDFRGQPLPALGTQFGVYRQGAKVGTVQIGEPVRARFAAADILQGELRVGDTVR
jgi:hypothetical protein